MKKLMMILSVLALFSFVYAQETAEPVTNEDKMEETAGKEDVLTPAEVPAEEENAAPAVADNSAGESKFNKFMNREGKKALAGVKIGPEIYHYDGLAAGGFHFDAFFEYNFIKYFGLQTELEFAGGYYGVFRLPVIAQGNFPINDMFWLNAGAGFYIAAGYWGGWDAGMVIKSALEVNTKVGVFVADIRYSPSLRVLGYGTVAILFGYAVPLPF